MQRGKTILVKRKVIVKEKITTQKARKIFRQKSAWLTTSLSNLKPNMSFRADRRLMAEAVELDQIATQLGKVPSFVNLVQRRLTEKARKELFHK